ncbi:hypothetical protein PHLGIDRAFT_219719 [Phlebiopsis gigantea 11061_1 CR5-6]|uniref:Glycopeptide n=1 Tax=Phlebiopsis gigantea (strain 11061_1 CR5-6) TaxID=745531 RepID=A0A0C3NYM5_PHLG1|nr:hypothetical protein PHLGIDRAFT_219719 [Phlebiopsis gigantea 11061_1 CR5-6]
MASYLFTVLTIFVALLVGVQAETHTITFINNCGFGTPTLEDNGEVLSTGQTVTVNGPLTGAIAFLQTGSCGYNGEGCTVIKLNLENPTTLGTGSSAEISISPPHAFSVPSGFGFTNGCEGIGGDCTTANCPLGTLPGGPVSPIACQSNDADIVILFCD